MEKNKILNEIFDVASIEGEVITKAGEVIVPESNSVDDNIDYDYEKSRANLHNLLNQGQEALIYALEVAKSSEHPRAYEVVGNLVKQLADVNHQLMDLSEKKQKLSKKQEENNTKPSSVTNNAIFVGSTNELKQMLHNLNKGD